MTDWMTQTQAGVDRWIEAQRDWWTTMQRGASGGAQDQTATAAERMQHDAVEAWRKAAHQVVDAQAQLLTAAGRPPGGGDAEAMVRRWTDAQREMWQGWLAAAGQGEGAGSGDLSSAGRQMADSLQQAAEQLVQSQAEWAKAWGSSQQGTSGAPGQGTS